MLPVTSVTATAACIFIVFGAQAALFASLFVGL